MEWFKLYHEARRDKKLSILTLAERGVWINLLCYASEQAERGTFNASDRFTLALECADGDEDVLNNTIEKLLRIHHLVTAYVTSETTRNERNESVTASVTSQWLVFRTFEARQAQKASNFPSDAPERITARVRKHRASLKTEDDVTSETTRNDTEEDEDREEEREKRSLSGNSVSNPSDDDVERAPATATNVSQSWTDAELRKVSKRIAGRLKLTNPDLDGLMTILAQYSHAPPYLEAEAAKCAEWYSGKRRKIDIRLYDNWLNKAEQRRRQNLTPVTQSMNGHTPSGNGTEASINGTTERTRRETANDEERARVAAQLVREQRELAAGRRLPREVP